MHVWAYEFTAPTPIEALEAALNRAGPWSWQLRDSHWYGDYLNVRPLDKLRVRIHEQGAGMLEWEAAARRGVTLPDEQERRRRGTFSYRLLVEMDDGCASERPAIDGVLSSLLRGVDAHDIREIAPYD